MHKTVEPLPGYPEPYGLLLAILQDATRDWRGELDADLDAEATTWRVRESGPSIGAIFLHMVAVEVFWFERFVLEADVPMEIWEELKARETNVDEGIWPDAPAQPISWYFALQDRYRARTLETIRRWPAPDTLKPRDGEPLLYSMPWVLGHVIQHETYHGGQMVLIADLWKRSSSAVAP